LQTARPTVSFRAPLLCYAMSHPAPLLLCCATAALLHRCHATRARGLPPFLEPPPHSGAYKTNTPILGSIFRSPLELQPPLPSLHLLALVRPPFSLIFLPFGLTAAEANSPPLFSHAGSRHPAVRVRSHHHSCRRRQFRPVSTRVSLVANQHCCAALSFLVRSAWPLTVGSL
jgi:hypothetical protein